MKIKRLTKKGRQPISGINDMDKKEKEAIIIAEKLAEIKKYCGLSLELCDCFAGITKKRGIKYFNVILKDPIYLSNEYKKLEKLAETTTIISKVEPNGYARVAIIF